MTSPEKVLFRSLQIALQPYMQRAWPQHVIGPYIADFMISGAFVVVEVDGRSHDSEKAKQYDRSRETYMENIGFRTLRFSNGEVMRDCAGVTGRILHFCTLTPADKDNFAVTKCPPGNAKYSGPFVVYGVPHKRKTMKTALSSFGAVKVFAHA